MRPVGVRKVPAKRDLSLACIDAISLSQKLTYEYEDRYACMLMHTCSDMPQSKPDSE